MRTRCLGKKTALRTLLKRAALVSGLGFFAACSGVEADVLSLRPLAPPMATVDAGAADGGPPSLCKTQTISISGCVDLMSWMLKVQSICSSLGLIPGPIALSQPCGGTSGQIARFECCPAPVCTPRLQGDQVSLMSLLEPCDTTMRRFRMLKYLCCSGPTLTSTAP
jgi:hypothetical protein